MRTIKTITNQTDWAARRRDAHRHDRDLAAARARRRANRTAERFRRRLTHT